MTMVDGLVDLIQELRSWLDQTQTMRKPDRMTIRLALVKARHLLKRVRAMRESLGDSTRRPNLVASFENLARALESYRNELEAYRSHLELELDAPLKQIRVAHQRLAESYEEALKWARREFSELKLKTGFHIKPRNYLRNLFHAFNGTATFGLYHFYLSREQGLWVLGSLAVFFGAIEIARKFAPGFNDLVYGKIFGLVARPGEKYSVNAATYYLWALLLVVALYPKPAAEMAVLVLAFADPLASLLGRRFGTRKIYGQKSWVGTTAFFVTAAASCAAFVALTDTGLASVWVKIGVVASVSVAGTVAELFCERVDDNFAILAFAGAIASLWFTF